MVVHAVPLAQECIAQDGQGTNGLGEVHSHEAADAGALNLEDVVIGADGEVVAGQGEGEVGQAITLIALHAVLTSEALLGTNLLVQELGHGGGQSNERSAGVKDDASVLELSGVLAKGDGIEVHLPVSLAPKGDVDHLAGVVALVHATECGLGLVTLLVGVTQVEGEHGLIQETLVQRVVEGRNHLIDGDGVKAQTQDTVEAAKGKSQTRLLGSLGEVLVLDLQVANLQSILGYEAAQATRSVPNGELGAVLLVGAR